MESKAIKTKRIKKGTFKEFFQKLSRGLMLPIALLPIAGLFLGVGAGIENVMLQSGVDALSASLLPWQIMKQIGDVIFANLPALFAIGIAIAFTEDAGVAALAGFVGWIVFNMTQNALIWDYGNVMFDAVLADGTTVTIAGSGFVEFFEGIVGELTDVNSDYLRYFSTESMSEYINFINAQTIDGQAVITTTWSTSAEGYGALWYRGTVPTSVIGTNVGITSMQTSVFGGIAVGSLVAFLYNKFHTFQMPKVLGFFSGTRFVPIITFLLMPILGLFFLMLWPIVGIGLDTFGRSLASAPAGVDALAFGYIERILIPFGLHHAFYTPLWYTSVGGSLYIIEGGEIISEAFGNQSIWFEAVNVGANLTNLTDTSIIVEDALLGSHNIEGNFHVLTLGNDTFAYLTAGINPGAYMQGKFPFMMFGLPAAGAAMIMAARKENRQMAASIIGAAVITSFLTGITEPIEFTFLFLAPWLFFGFHAVMASMSFWALDMLNVHVGMTFSGGIFDLILFGIIPDATGMGANHWHIYWVGALYVPIYYTVFYYSITKMNILTPGRTADDIKMKSKADYQAKKA